MLIAQTRNVGLCGIAIACLCTWHSRSALALDDRATTVSYWIGPPSGAWQTASFWSPAGIPANNGRNLFDVVIDPEPGQSSTVSLTGSVQIQLLWVTENDTLQLANNSTLGLAGAHTTFDGTFNMLSTGNSTVLRLDADVILGGTGLFSASNSLGNILYSPSGGRLTVAEDLIIAGSMQLGQNQLKLTNHGMIQADLSQGIQLDLTDAGPNYNDGTLRAFGGSTLTIMTGSIDNTDGLIAANNGSFVLLSGTSVTGGILQDVDGAGAGAVRNVATCTLTDVTIQGEFTGANNTATNVYGGIDLQGPFRLASTGNSTTLRLQTSPFALAGTGGIRTSDSLGNIIVGTNSSTRLINPVGSTISGSMQLGQNQLLLTNHGTVESNAPQGITLDLTDAGPNLNDGTVRSTIGALTILAATIDNTGGAVEADANSLVNLQGCTITGGTLRDVDGVGPGAVRNVSTCTLVDVTVEGELNVNNNTTTHLHDGIVLQGPLRMNSTGNSTLLRVHTSPFVLGGTGGVLASNSQGNIIVGNTSAIRLEIPAGNQIRGSMQLGQNQLLLTNHGLIQADANQGVQLDVTDAGPNYNDGILRASSTATLTILAGSLDNTNGVIEAETNSIVSLSGCSIAGGTLRDIDGPGLGLVRNSSTCTLTDVRVEGEFNCNNNTNTNAYGTLDADGPVKLNSTGNSTALRAQTSLTINGAGGVQCTNTPANLVVGVNPAHMITIGPDSLLRGSCQLGQNTVGLRNQGTILADANQGITIDPADAGGFTNEGTLHLTGGNVALNAGTFANQGTVIVDPGFTLSRSGSYLQTAGSTKVNGILSASTGVALQGGMLAGAGQVTTAVNNSGGTVAPGNSAGILTLSQPYTQGAGGSFSVEIGGATPGTQHDQLVVTGNATLAGTITVARIGGFIPTNGQTFVVLTCSGTRTGTFSTVESCDPVSIIYGAQTVSVQYLGSFGIVGDLDHNGIVDGADLGTLLGDWGVCDQACCSGDLNGDGLVDGADLGTLLGNWG